MQLARVCCAILLGSAAAAAPPAHHAPKLGLRGGKKDVSAVPQQLSAMIATSQRQLAFAERHHEKAVQKERGQYTEMLSKEASILGKAVQRFAAQLDGSVSALQQAQAAAKSVLALEEPPSTGFASALVQARARLSAEVDAAEREIRRDQRKRDHSVREAVTQAGSALEEGSQMFSRKTGDLSQLLDGVKSSLEAIATSAPEGSSTGAASGSGSAKAPAATKANKALMESAMAQLKDVKARSRAAIAAADKQLAGDIEQVQGDVGKSVASFQKALSDAEKMEIARVRGKPKLF